MSTEETKQQSSARKDHLRDIEIKMQTIWEDSKINENTARPWKNFDTKQKEKFFVTFPYPYMNGRLHLGHAFSMSKCEFTARYHKLLGKNAMWPFGFHCTGMPIQAAANKLKIELGTEERKKDVGEITTSSQKSVLIEMGVPEDEIHLFQDPSYWLKYFPPYGLKDLKQFGVCCDWRRSFITTSANPFYDSFIRWQFNTLKKKGKIEFGKRPTIYSIVDGQVCADHDRASGENVTPQEYTIIKLKILELPKVLNKLKGKAVYLVAATLRPETMYGQTNCFVLPEGKYGVFEMINNEYFVSTERAMRNMAYQGLTKEHGKWNKVADITGTEMIGLPLHAPLSKYQKVYAIPLLTISMNKGTGIVTSVPSDAPDDWAALKDFQTKKGLREKYNVKEEWVAGFDPVPIIDIPDFGTLTAVTLCEERKVVSQKDTEKLKEIKEITYNKGFYTGKMIVGAAKGKLVSESKVIVRQVLFDNNEGAKYWEPENPVVSRSGDQCIVALCDQWFLKYGEENWQRQVMTHIKSDNFNAYTPQCQRAFEDAIDWLKEWACSRLFGLGTKLPWDQQFVIESLSDSTVYFAYYTINHLLHPDNLDGINTNKDAIQPEHMTHEVWDHIFLSKKVPADCKINKALLDEMKREFEYWYPLDLRCSAKDLIKNHLSFSMYNHAAIWEDPKMMPQSMFCNGYIMLNNDKMSKSTGNFLSLTDGIQKYGADACRIALADSGDSMDDANFVELVANSAVLKIFVLEKWIEEEIKKVDWSQLNHSEYGQDFDLVDQIFDNELNNLVIDTQKAFEEIKFKLGLRSAWFDLQQLRDDYVQLKKGTLNPALVLRFIEIQITMMSPIIPHFSDHVWRTFYLPAYNKTKNGVQKTETVIYAGWPEITRPTVDYKLKRIFQYIKTTKKNIMQSFIKVKQVKGKKGQQAEKEIKNVILFVAKEYPENQIEMIKIMQGMKFNKAGEIQDNHVNVLKEKIQDKKQLGLAMKFASHLIGEAKTIGKDQALELSSPFDEVDVLNQMKGYLFEDVKMETTGILLNTHDIEEAKIAKEGATPGKPTTFFFNDMEKANELMKTADEMEKKAKIARIQREQREERELRESQIDTEQDDGKKMNKGEKKCRKALLKQGMKQISGISRVTLKKREGLIFAINDPEVLKSGTNENTFVVFGELKIEDPTQNFTRGQQSHGHEDHGHEGHVHDGQCQDHHHEEEKKVIVEEGDEDLNEEGVNVDYIDMVMNHTSCTRGQAIKALKKNNNDMVTAVMELTNK